MPGSLRSSASVSGKRPPMLRHHRPGAGMEIARPRIIAKPGPGLQHIVQRCRGKRLDGWPQAREPLEIGLYRLNRGLLQHDLGQPDAVGIGRRTRQRPPGQDPGIARRTSQEAVMRDPALVWPFCCARTRLLLADVPIDTAMDTLDKHFRELTRQAFARYGFAYAEVIARWPEIVGEALARHARPNASSGRAARAKAPRNGAARWSSRAAPGRALDLQYEVSRIIERINGFYGYRGHRGGQGHGPAKGLRGPCPTSPCAGKRRLRTGT